MIYLHLDQPFDPGSYDTGNTYPHAFITVFNMNTLAQVIEIRYEYGTFDAASGWTTGKASVTQIAHIQGQDFFEAITAKPDSTSDDSVLMMAARQSYEYLIKTTQLAGEVTEAEVEAPAAPAPDAGATADSGATGSTDAGATADSGATAATDSGATAATDSGATADAGATGDTDAGATADSGATGATDTSTATDSGTTADS